MTYDITHSRSSQQKKQRFKSSNESLCEPRDSSKKINLRIIRIPEGEEKEEKANSLFKEIIV